jgi:nitrate/nitrite transport system ATP-binding protein
MITHDVDEAIYLADRIVLMTNGPTQKSPRSSSIHCRRSGGGTTCNKHPAYYAIRNHLIDFLVLRSRTFADEIKAGRSYDPRKPPQVIPSTPGPVAVSSPVRAAPSIESVEKRSGRVP